jgi:hypothetical protein
VRERKSSKPIPREPINAGLIEEELRPMRGHDLKRVVQRTQVGAVFATVRQLDVKRAPLLAEGVILATVEREREDVGVVGEDRCRAIALVHIEIDHGDALGAMVAPRHGDGHGEIVEDAEPLPATAERVVGTAGQVSGSTVREGPGERGQRAAGRAARSVHQPLAPRETEPPDGAGIEGALADCVEVGRVVHQPEVLPRGARRVLE